MMSIISNSYEETCQFILFDKSGVMLAHYICYDNL